MQHFRMDVKYRFDIWKLEIKALFYAFLLDKRSHFYVMVSN